MRRNPLLIQSTIDMARVRLSTIDMVRGPRCVCFVDICFLYVSGSLPPDSDARSDKPTKDVTTPVLKKAGIKLPPDPTTGRTELPATGRTEQQEKSQQQL